MSFGRPPVTGSHRGGVARRRPPDAAPRPTRRGAPARLPTLGRLRGRRGAGGSAGRVPGSARLPPVEGVGGALTLQEWREPGVGGRTSTACPATTGTAPPTMGSACWSPPLRRVGRLHLCESGRGGARRRRRPPGRAGPEGRGAGAGTGPHGAGGAGRGWGLYSYSVLPSARPGPHQRPAQINSGPRVLRGGRRAPRPQVPALSPRFRPKLRTGSPPSLPQPGFGGTLQPPSPFLGRGSRSGAPAGPIRAPTTPEARQAKPQVERTRTAG